jgi:AcrR family transcriptional regulator
MSSLPRTAQKILAAARKLLIEGGYEAMTLENVAGEAGVNKASIRYNFGNKAGLVIAVLDAYIHDEYLRLVATMKDVPPEDVVATAMSGMRNMLVEADSFQGYFDILPHALREPELRERMLALYKWWYLQNLAWLGLRDVPGVEQNETLVGLGELVRGHRRPLHPGRSPARRLRHGPRSAGVRPPARAIHGAVASLGGRDGRRQRPGLTASRPGLAQSVQRRWPAGPGVA